VNADVSIRNVATNVAAKTKTNNAGIYYLPSLPPGRYELRAESRSFRPSVVSDIALGAGLTATFNLTLEVGAVTEAISVQASAVQLQAQTSGLGSVVPTRNIQEMPLLGRNAVQLVSLLPGVTPNGGATVGDQAGVRMSGGLATQNGLLTDGGESRNVMRTDQSFTVPLESVAEFRIDTATYSAEYGRSGGGVVNIVTKSGTNAYHGVGYEFLRNDHLNANSWQNNRNNGFADSSNATSSGSVRRPDCQNRTSSSSAPKEFAKAARSSRYGPSAEQRRGITQNLDRTGALTMVYDPLTTRADLALGAISATHFPETAFQTGARAPSP
jgi:outer membrane receptor for ferrienterochelin and colicin